MRYNYLSNKFNRGIISPLAFARVDFENLGDACQDMENWQPMRMGPMMYRPGSEDLGDIPNECYLVPFHFAQGDTAKLEYSDSLLRVWEDDVLVTRNASTTVITNGTFDTDLTGWTDNDDVGAAASEWKVGGHMSLIGDGTGSARRNQTLSTEVGVEQAIRITISDAPVRFTIGYTVGGTGIYSGILPPGVHSLAMTPTSDVVIEFSNSEKYEALVTSVEVESAGIMTIPTPVPVASLPLIRYKQSADVVFIAVEGQYPFEIQRRGQKSWSVVELWHTGGPFHLINTTDITLTPGEISGETTLTASASLFNDNEWLNTLVRIDSIGQTVEATLSGSGQQTSDIRVTGIEDSREFQVILSGTWSATVTLQRSAGGVGSWEDFRTYTTNGTKNVDDGFDNSIMHYRLSINTGDYTSGSVEVVISYPNGSITGQARVTAVNSQTSASIKILSDLGSTAETLNWYRGQWNAEDGYPTATDLFEGRLVFSGKNRTQHSVSEAYRSFDDTVEGDSKAFQRTIGFGAVDVINWIVSFMRIILGTAGSEVILRSTSFGEPLTATTANLKEAGEEGSAKLDKVKVGGRGYFVDYTKIRIIEILDTSDGLTTADMMSMNPEIAVAGIRRIVAQNQPERRIHAVLDDGTVVIALMDDLENIRSFYQYTTDGIVEDACVLKADEEDRVYYVVNRDGNRRMEKFALMRECRGGSISKHFDCFKHYSSPGTVTLTGLDHLDGETVGAWADGYDIGTFTVASGSITVPEVYDEVTVGLKYTAYYKSLKVGMAGPRGTALMQKKKISMISLLMKWVAPGALTHGPNYTQLDDMPQTERGVAIDDETDVDYDEVSFSFGGRWDTDSRVCLVATGPATVLASVYTTENSEKG